MVRGEATNANFIIFGLARLGLEPMIYHTETSALTITPPVRLIVFLRNLEEINFYAYSLDKTPILLTFQPILTRVHLC